MASVKRLFVNLSSDTPSAAFVRSFIEAAAPSPIQIARSDSFQIELHFLAVNPISTPGRPFVYVDPIGWSGAKFAMGSLGAKPDGGVFTLTDFGFGQTASNLAYNITAAALQAALRAALTTHFSTCTVTGADGGPFRVDSMSTVANLDLTANATNLAPDGSTVAVIKTQNGNAGSLTNRWSVQPAQALPVLNTVWEPLPSASVETSVVQIGSGTANKAFRVVWNADAYFGGVLLSFNDGTDTFTVGPIAYNASTSDVAAAFLATGAGNGVDVVQNNLGDFTITCTGTNIALSDDPTLDPSSETLMVPVGYTGLITASTAGVDLILNGAASATTYCEVEVRQEPGEPQTAAQINNAVFIADLITNGAGFATGTEDWATIGDVLVIAPHIFADLTAKNNDVPYTPGQLGFQLDDKSIWYASPGTDPGDWQHQGIGAHSWTVGASGVIDAALKLYGGGFGDFFGTILASNITANARQWQMPDASGTLALAGGGSPWLIKATTYTAVSGERIQADTSGGGFTINLPAAATAGDSVQIEDALGTWNGSALTVGRNGLKINGGTSDYTGNVDGAKLSIVYIDATTGWSIK